MIKHLKILEFAISSLWRRKFKNLGIIFVFSLIIFVLSSILLLTYSFKKEAIAVLEGAPELIVQRISAGRHALMPVEYMKKVEKIPGVGAVIPRLWGYYYDISTGGNYTVMAEYRGLKDLLNIMEGTFTGEKGTCLIGKGISDARFAVIGSIIPIIGSDGKVRRLKTVGIFTDESRIITNDLIIITPEDFRDIFNLPENMVTDIVVQVYNPTEVDNIARKIKQILPDTRPITKNEILRTYDTLFDWRSGMVLTMFLGAILAFIILAWDKATGLSAEERHEIGILKSIGWETSDVMELKFWEGLVISSLSFLTGLIGGYIHIFFFGASVFSPALKGWSVIFPEFHLMPYINPYQIVVLLFMTVIPYMAATIVPSWKAAITDPDVVMRG
ncbi:MAG: FtsX-like permease family protein [Nitrospirae bacterium]|nr:FtsX-like permease family protein [Nitrospirota bacterium]